MFKRKKNLGFEEYQGQFNKLPSKHSHEKNFDHNCQICQLHYSLYRSETIPSIERKKLDRDQTQRLKTVDEINKKKKDLTPEVGDDDLNSIKNNSKDKHENSNYSNNNYDTENSGGFNNAFKHFTGFTSDMGSVSLFLYISIFLISLTFAFLLIIIFMPFLSSIDRGLLFGLGGLIQDFLVSIIFIIVLILGICAVFSGFTVFYSIIEVEGFTAIIFKNIAILLSLGMFTMFFSSSTKQSDPGTIQVLFIYFYLLITLAAIIAWLGIVNSLPKVFVDLLKINKDHTAVTQNFLKLIIIFFAVLGPVFFASGTIETVTITEGFMVSVISNSIQYDIDIFPEDVKNDFQVEDNIRITSLRQNSSTELSLRIKNVKTQDQQNYFTIENDLENISGEITSRPTTNNDQSESVNTSSDLISVPVRFKTTSFSDSSWFISTSFIIPSFKGTILVMDISIPVIKILYGVVYQKDNIHIIVQISTYNKDDPEAPHFFLEDVSRIFGSYSLKTTNFLVIILGSLGLLMTLATLIQQFTLVQRSFAFDFFDNSYLVFFQPLLPLILALALLATLINSVYLDTLRQLLIF